MKRLLSSIAFSLPLYTALFTLFAGILFHLILHLSLDNAYQQSENRVGQLLAQQLAARSTQPLLNQDPLSLQVDVAETASLPGVASAYILDSNGQPLTEKVSSNLGRLSTFTAKIVLDGKKPATAVVELDTQYLMSPYTQLMFSSSASWILLSALLILIASKLGKSWCERLTILSEQLPANNPGNTTGQIRAPEEIGRLEQALTPLLLNSHPASPDTTSSYDYQSIVSMELRGLSRLETQLNQDNFLLLLDRLDTIIEFILRLYSGNHLTSANHTLQFSFGGTLEDDDHPVRALYAAEGLKILVAQLETELAMKLDIATCITTDQTSPDLTQIHNALTVEQQLDRASLLLKVLSIHELGMDNATATHPTLDDIALLEPLNPEHTLFRCDGLSETSQTLLDRQLAFYKKKRVACEDKGDTDRKLTD